jgi:hypothetical protein
MTNIALFIDGCDPQVSTLEAFLEVSGFTPVQKMMAKHHMSLGVQAHFKNPDEADVTMVSLDHCDAPHNAAGDLVLDQMSDMLNAFCNLHGLPCISADEVLAEYYATTHHELADFGIVNWLADFIEAWDNPDHCETPHEPQMIFSPLAGMVEVAS